ELKASTRIAMTGTPIENHLSDLWSLFDFLDGGLLGSAKEFTGFTKGLNKDPSGYAKLRNLVNPFILRRLKTDATIISDLPDKVEIKEFPVLSKKQIVLYQNLVAELAKKLKEADGIARKGLVLSSIIKLKQICNHPDQYLGQDLYKRDHSGKFEMLESICETIYEKRERVLVFTQFKELTEPLAQFLEEIFHRPGLVLHGGTPVTKRTELVEAFNGEAYIPFMVLSLKAGGVGLNLTGANNVIHFDRWWNPAVENQATDRAFRIGQNRDVMVHKFITLGTIEEKIDAMIEEKSQLAGDIIKASGETWITELDDEQLLKLLSLC
ncbi:MAG: DEAD/DEAH box helicase, partial [Acetobacterium sp.]|nr:DEAD/DEAH box helicase [Acetobacterium sp.]